MIDALSLDPQKFSGSKRLIIDEIRARGWKALCLHDVSGHIFIDRGDGRLVQVFGTTPPQQSYGKASLANNKYLTNLMLADAGIPQLPFMMVGLEDVESIQKFLENHSSVVIKPVDGSHGNGIRLGLRSLGQVTKAIEYAKQYTQAQRVLLQAQFQVDAPYDLRLLCMDGQFVAAIHRLPARVFGDGVHSLGALIDDENESSRRGKPYVYKYATIDRDRARRYLGDKVDSIPKNGEEVRVMDVANYGAGGELIDVTDQIPDWMKKQAELAASTLGIVVAGVDYLTSTLPTSNTQPEEIDSTIIEINKSPALMIHDEPHVGKNQNTVKRFLDIVADY